MLGSANSQLTPSKRNLAFPRLYCVYFLWSLDLWFRVQLLLHVDFQHSAHDGRQHKASLASSPSVGSLSTFCHPLVLSHDSLSIKCLWGYSKIQTVSPEHLCKMVLPEAPLTQQFWASADSPAKSQGPKFLIKKEQSVFQCCTQDQGKSMDCQPPKPVRRAALPTQHLHSAGCALWTSLSAAFFWLTPKKVPVL